MALRPDVLMASLAALLGAELEARTLQERLSEVVMTAVAVLEVDGAVLMLLDESDRLQAIAASDDAARMLGVAQEQLGGGPCVEATRRSALITVADLALDARWPGLWDEVAALAIGSVMSAPIGLSDRAAGSLNVLCRRPRHWTPGDEQALTAYGGVIAAYLRIALAAERQARLAEHLRRLARPHHARPGVGEVRGGGARRGEDPTAGRPEQESPTAPGRLAGRNDAKGAGA